MQAQRKINKCGGTLHPVALALIGIMKINYSERPNMTFNHKLHTFGHRKVPRVYTELSLGAVHKLCRFGKGGERRVASKTVY